MKCSVDGCFNIVNFKFPKSRPDILKKWLLAIGKANLVILPSSGLCSSHFTQEDYTHSEIDAPYVQRPRLRKDSIPSVCIFNKKQTCAEKSIQKSFKITPRLLKMNLHKTLESESIKETISQISQPLSESVTDVFENEEPIFHQADVPEQTCSDIFIQKSPEITPGLLEINSCKYLEPLSNVDLNEETISQISQPIMENYKNEEPIFHQAQSHAGGEKNFKVGDLVWAKMGGWWPAFILKTKSTGLNKLFHICWLGDWRTSMYIHTKELTPLENQFEKKFNNLCQKTFKYKSKAKYRDSAICTMLKVLQPLCTIVPVSTPYQHWYQKFVLPKKQNLQGLNISPKIVLKRLDHIGGNNQNHENINKSESSEKRIKVLSLFDGPSTGLVILKQLGLDVDVYYASEIDKDALSVSREHHGGFVKYLGDVRKIGKKTLTRIGPIDLLMGGSPCEDLSRVNSRRKGLCDETGTGVLFFHYVRIRNLLRRINKNTKLYWFFENVPMEHKYRMIINRKLGTKPHSLNSFNFSPQKKSRLYWTNLPWGPFKRENVILQDCLSKKQDRVARFLKINTIRGTKSSLYQGPKKELPVLQNGVPKHLMITELERIVGFEKSYTDVDLEKTSRLKILAKAWCIRTIKAIFRPLTSLFRTIR